MRLGSLERKAQTPSVSLHHPLTDEETECQRGPEPAPRSRGGGTRCGVGCVLVFVHGSFPTHRAPWQPAQGPSGSTCVSRRTPIE